MIGLTIGRHRILARLGPETMEPATEASSGPEISLWKAEDTLLRRTVALKVLSGARKMPHQARRRFLGEARGATMLDHPRIAAVLDFGQDGDRLYIASQLVEGETIQDRVRRAPMGIDEAVRIARAAADVLGIAHAGGVVHGDVSPETILLVSEGSGSQVEGTEEGTAGAREEPVLVGFGFALLQPGSIVTRSRTALGTAGYMAPEVVLGRAAEPRSDLYGLGAVLYLMLTRKLPFDEDRMAALLEGAVHHAAEAPSVARADVPPDMDRIVLKALAQNPAQRYQSAEEMAADLDAHFPPEHSHLEGVPDTAAPGAREAGKEAVWRRTRASDADWIEGPSIPLAVPELDRLVASRSRGADRSGLEATPEEEPAEAAPRPTGAGEAAGTARPHAGAESLEGSGIRPPESRGHALATHRGVGGIPEERPALRERAAGGPLAERALRSDATRGAPFEAGASPETARTGSRASHAASPSIPSLRTWRRGRLMAMGIGGFLLAAIAIVAVSKLGVLRGPALRGRAYDSVAVLPVKDLGSDGGRSQHLADGMGASLAAGLSHLPRLRVTPWSTSRRFPDSGQTVQDIGQKLNVGSVVASTFRRTSGRIEMLVSLVDTRTGSLVWSRSYEEALLELFTLQRRIAIEVAEALQGRLTRDEERDLRSQPSTSVEAYEEYLNGSRSAVMGRPEDDAALASFEKAVALDPRLAGAYLGIGTVHLERARRGSSDLRESLEAAEGAFREALRLDATNLAVRRGLIKTFWLQGRLEECLKIGREIPKGQGTAEILTAIAEAYLYGGLCDRAPSLLGRAIEMDPQNQDARFSLVLALTWSGQFRHAVEAGKAYLQEFRDDPEIHLAMGQSFWGLGELARAREEYVAIAQTPGAPAFQRFADEGRLDKALGDPGRARERWEAGAAVLQRYLKAHRKSSVTRFQLAELYALLGQKELFEQELARARQDRGALAGEPNEATAGYLALDEKDRAVESLHKRLAAGQLGQCWYHVERLSTSGLENVTGYNQLLKRYDANQDRLEAAY